MKSLKLGISTCPNDTFIYEALVQGLKGSPFHWSVQFADVQTLNEMVQKGELDVAKVSAQVYPQVESDYVCLNCGGAIGYGCGPLLLSSKNMQFSCDTVTLPGKDTTAALLFKFWAKKTQLKAPSIDFALFDQVYKRLLSKEISQGVVIHEHRFTWKQDGLYLLQDLGAFWELHTKTPIPLGISVAKRSLGFETISKIEDEIRMSLTIAQNRRQMVSDFIAEKAQINDASVMESHIKMFVNDFSMDVGERGRSALEFLWRLVKS